MKQRDKDKLTRQAVVAKISEIKDTLAKWIEDRVGQEEVSLNTVYLHQKVGALKALREVLFK